MSAIKNQKHMNTPEIRQGWLRQFIFFIVLAVVTMLLAMLILRLYTRHGQKIEMLDLTGKNLTEAEELVQKTGLNLLSMIVYLSSENPEESSLTRIPSREVL
ncbi:MAG: hypothetical protein IPK25_12645 [Saprospiraceae bacterium]|nr:hypothetical protein [Saprospiraceae bacterium]